MIVAITSRPNNARAHRPNFLFILVFTYHFWWETHRNEIMICKFASPFSFMPCAESSFFLIISLLLLLLLLLLIGSRKKQRNNDHTQTLYDANSSNVRYNSRSSSTNCLLRPFLINRSTFRQAAGRHRLYLCRSRVMWVDRVERTASWAPIAAPDNVSKDVRSASQALPWHTHKYTLRSKIFSACPSGKWLPPVPCAWWKVGDRRPHIRTDNSRWVTSSQPGWSYGGREIGCVSDINAGALDARRTVQCVPVSQCRRITTAAALHCVHQWYTVAPQTAAYHSVETCLANVLRNFLKTWRYVHGAQNFYIRLYSPRRQHTYRRT